MLVEIDLEVVKRNNAELLLLQIKDYLEENERNS